MLAILGTMAGALWAGGQAKGASNGLPPSAQLRAVDLVSSTQGWVGGVFVTQTGEENKEVAFVAFTRSGGADWEVLHGLGNGQGRMDEWIGRAVNAIDFVDESHGWVVFDDGTILATSDRGRTWLVAAEGSFDFRDNNFSYQSISMFDNEHGCAVGSWVGFIGIVYPRVAFTTNGKDWTAFELKDFPGFALSGVCMLSATEGWAIGSAASESGPSLLLHTTDGGATWQDRSRTLPAKTSGLQAVWFADARHGWAVGEAGKVLATVDGGASWWLQPSGVPVTLLSVRFSDRWVGWASGEKGTLLETNDGGQLWKPVCGETTATLRGVGVAQGHVWIVGDDSTVLKREIPRTREGQWFFSDIASSPYAPAIESLAVAGVVDGFVDGTYHPNEPAKRAQVAKVTARLLGLASGSGLPTKFVDLGMPDPQGYPHKYVQALLSLGVLEKLGAADSQFGPWEFAGRDQAVAVVINAAQKAFPQLEQHGLNDLSLLAGIYPPGSGWDPRLPISRGELAQLLCNLHACFTGEQGLAQGQR